MSRLRNVHAGHNQAIAMDCGQSINLGLGSTPSHGNPASTTSLNTELNNVARNIGDTEKAKLLVAAGADLRSTNGPPWNHTPLHQAAYHGHYEMACTLVALRADLNLHSNPCGRGCHGTPLELAQGGGHQSIARMIEDSMKGQSPSLAATPAVRSPDEVGEWTAYDNVDMCAQGDVEIIPNWKAKHSIDDLKKIVVSKGYSAFTVSNGLPAFGHAALKSFDFELRREHCKPISTCCNHPCRIYIWAGNGNNNGGKGRLVIKGHYFSFPRVGSPSQVVDRFEARSGGTTVTFYRDGPVGCTAHVHSAIARPMESYYIDGTTLRGPATGTVEPNGDISWSHGYISRKEDVGMLPNVVAVPAAQDMAQLPAPQGEVACIFSRVDNQAFDQNGVLHAIGTDWGVAGYSNPAETGKVRLGWSRDAANYYSTVGGHKVGDARQAASVICANSHPGANATMWSMGAPKAYFEVDLVAVTLRPTYFAFRNDYGGGGNHPRTFELQGSVDGRSWTTLRQHTNEGWNGKSAKAWPVHGHAYFRIFRIQNLGAPHHLCCSGLELYGLVRGAPNSVAVSVDATCAEDIPVVVGTVLETSNGSDPPLFQMIQMLKHELGVGGSNLVETVNEAVEVLGLEAEVAGLGLVDKARKCKSKMFG